MLTLIAWALLLAVLVPNLVHATETLCGLRPRALPLPGAPRPRTAILMPAHDEAAGIAAIVAAARAASPGGTRLLVVADNCTDDTARLAREAGAEVIERTDPDRRGKGYALAFGRDALAAGAAGAVPDAVVVLDSDCTVEPGTIERLARGAVAHGRPIQGCYLIEPRPGAAPMLQISGFAFLVKNLVRQRGLDSIGAPAMLTGSGMAFPWTLFADAPLATGDLVEDLALGIGFTRAGHAPRFDAGARAWTAPSTAGGTLTQRTRWEHGFVATARTRALPLVREGLATRRPALVWLGLHLLTPPLALMLTMDAAALAAGAALWLLGAAELPLLLLFVLVGTVCGAVLAAWWRHGRDQMGAATLLRLPGYLLWKLPIYLKLVRRAETRWVRTERDGDGPPDYKPGADGR